MADVTQSFLSGNNAAYIEELYEQFLENPSQVSEQWRRYFESLPDGRVAAHEVSHRALREQLRAAAMQPKTAAMKPTAPRQEAVDQLIIAYRRFGHLNADLDPLGSRSPGDVRLTLSHYQLSDADMDRPFLTRGVLPASQAPLRDIYAALQRIYCGHIGIEYTRITDEEERTWLRDYIESRLPNIQFSPAEQRRIFQKLTAADGMEKYLERKYPAQKRFSIEGADALIPMLDDLVQRARTAGLQELIIGMAHRGRLNVLLNTTGMPPRELFQQFEGIKDYGLTTGDVKYHLGFSMDTQTGAGSIHLSLMFNPSHLEFVNTVVMGAVRAHQERQSAEISARFNYAAAVMIHGDASFAGQGVIMEGFNMSQTRAYDVGGAIHIILNNQVGFTTSDPRDARSSRYCSDPAKMIDIPIFHVNGDDAEAAVKVMQIALDYRMKFHKDVVIDLVCYRRHGHNEADEPRATQPLMYAIIDQHPAPRLVYAQRLIQQNILKSEDIEQEWEAYNTVLDQGNPVVKVQRNGLADRYVADWSPFMNQNWNTPADTAVPKQKLLELGKKFTEFPPGFQLQRNVAMLMDHRKKMTAEQEPLDWGYAETMAYATLLAEGHRVRFSGEDSRRGTFFHRHAVVFDQKTGAEYAPLSHLAPRQGRFDIYDSLLSEAGVIGFEWGYAASDPNALVIWEAQYGDFANTGQVYIDQFLSSAWQKWNLLCGLVLLLPHGQQGEGPEHTSARLERYLQLCAQDNMQVVVPSTPGQMFHLLRRQVLRPYRTPLVVMSPKSLLRHKLAVSTFEDLSTGRFQLVIGEIDKMDSKKVRKVILCSGKVYYELLEKRREENKDAIAILRLEQLYPFPYDEVKAALADYAQAKTIVWCQEEPMNQGAWYILYDRLMACVPAQAKLEYAGREAMAAPSGGYSALHKKQQIALINQALA